MDFLDLLIDIVAPHHKKKIEKVGTSECLREHTWSIIRNARHRIFTGTKFNFLGALEKMRNLMTQKF